MQRPTLKLGFDYQQIWVFQAGLENPINKATRQHFEQGFAWRPGSVTFRTLIHAGIAEIGLSVWESSQSPSADAKRIIDVPFEVPDDGRVEVGGFASRAIVDLPPGLYTLRFEAFEPNSPAYCRISLAFYKNTKPEFRIVRADPGLRIEGDLLIAASPHFSPESRKRGSD
jgi:hypothetical protein